MTKASDNEFPSVLFDEQAGDPSTPASGFWRAYMKSDGMYVIDDAGTVTGPFAESTGGSGFSGDILDYQVQYKSADETVNNSAALQNDDALVIAIGANEVWRYEIDLFFSSGTTPDFKVAIDLPAGATSKWWAPEAFQASAVAWGNNVNSTLDGSRDFEGAGAGTFRGLHIIGVCINGANAGSIQLQWAQNTANASDTVVYAGSVIRGERVA